MDCFLCYNFVMLARDYIDEICSKYTHAVFDLDGTLIDSMPVWKNSARTFLRTLGIEAEANLNDVLFNLSLIHGAEYIQKTYTPNLEIQQILDGVEDVVVGAYEKTIPLRNGALEFLQELKARGVRCSIATSNDMPLVKLALERLKVAQFFESIFTCTDLKTSKDEPRVYLEAMQSIGGTIENTIVFEDALLPIKTATKAGFAVAAMQDSFSIDDWPQICNLATYTFTDF